MLVNGTWLRRLSLLAIVGILCLVPLTPVGAGGGSVPKVTVIASGLNSPRGLALLRHGSFLVAEAGKGGPGPCGDGPLGEMCVGRTGAVTLGLEGQLRRLAHLPGIALPDGSFAFGPHDVAVGSPHRSFYATIGLAGDVDGREQFGRKGSLLGHLVRVTQGGYVQDIADLVAYEEAKDPDGNGPDSDPYGLLRTRHGSIVTDAGGNSLLKVTDDGDISTLAVFPDRLVDFRGDKVPIDAVPTPVVRGPDGALYVGQLTGFPYPVGGARVFRIGSGGDPEIFARGFTNIIDIAFGPRGGLYVLEIAHNSLRANEPYGALLRVTPSGEKKILLDEGLAFPTSVALLGGGTFLVTNCGVCPGGGEVLKVEL
jgi:hypothetical protein